MGILFDGIFSTLMYETYLPAKHRLRSRRCHRWRQNFATYFFTAFYTLCRALLAEYIRQTDTAESMALQPRWLKLRPKGRDVCH